MEISEEDEGVIIKGSLDTLVLKDRLWLMVIEAKRGSFSIEAGLPQILAYRNYAELRLQIRSTPNL